MKYLLLIWLGLLAALAALPAMSIEVTTDIESGGGKISAEGVSVTIMPVIDPLGKVHSSWVHFRISDAMNETVRFTISNVDGINEFKQGKRMVYSCGDDWRYMDPGSVEGEEFVFSHEFECDTAEVATFFPYTVSMLEDYLDSISDDGNVEVSSAGKSTGGRDIPVVEVTDFSDKNDKLDIFIIARQHPAETSASFILEGLIGRLLDDPDKLRGLRYVIVPIANVDGVALGHTRSDSQDDCSGELCDMNRNWDSDDNHDVDKIKTALEEMDRKDGVDMFIDIHGYAGGEDRSGYLAQGGHAREFADILDDKSNWGNPKGLYKYIQESCTPDAGKAKVFGCELGADPSFTFEPAQSLSSWTTGSFRRHGALLADAIDEYYADREGDGISLDPAGPDMTIPDEPEQPVLEPVEPNEALPDGLAPDDVQPAAEPNQTEGPVVAQLPAEQTAVDEAEPAKEPVRRSRSRRSRPAPEATPVISEVALESATQTAISDIQDAPVTVQGEIREPADNVSSEISEEVLADIPVLQDDSVEAAPAGTPAPTWNYDAGGLCWT